VFSKTIERKQFLDELLAKSKVDELQLRKAFLAAPLRSTNYTQKFGTVYTAIYKPLSETMSYHWPAGKAWRHSFVNVAPAVFRSDWGIRWRPEGDANLQ
jgi:hypothetical protein